MAVKTEKVQLIEHVLELEEKVYRALRPIMPKEWLCVDLTMPQLKIMLLLFTDGPARMGVLASTLGVSVATTTGITDRLVQQDLIVRSSDPEDRRAVVCSLSEKGKEVVRRLWELGQSRARSLLEKMTSSKLRLLCEAMETILEAAEGVEQNELTRENPSDKRNPTKPN